MPKMGYLHSTKNAQVGLSTFYKECPSWVISTFYKECPSWGYLYFKECPRWVTFYKECPSWVTYLQRMPKLGYLHSTKNAQVGVIYTSKNAQDGLHSTKNAQDGLPTFYKECPSWVIYILQRMPKLGLFILQRMPKMGYILQRMPKMGYLHSTKNAQVGLSTFYKECPSWGYPSIQVSSYLSYTHYK